MLSHWPCLMATGVQAHAMSTWASKSGPQFPYYTAVTSKLASDIMDLNSFPRSETDLAINIRKATSIGQSLQYDYLKFELRVGLISVHLPRGDCTQTYPSPPTSTLKSSLCSRYSGKHVRACIVYTWDHKSSQSFWAGMKVCV